MRTNTLLLAASALATATAQAPDLATAIKTQQNLSTLLGLLGQVSNTTAFLASQPNVTLFAPSDEAFASIVSEGGIFSIEQAAIDPGLIEQILRYHLYKGVIKAEDIAKFPDANLAESLQRVPGVALARGDGGEGKQITVRGLNSGFTRVRINGIEAVAATGASDINGSTFRQREWVIGGQWDNSTVGPVPTST